MKNLFNVACLIAIWAGSVLFMGITLRIMWTIFMTGWGMLP